ncbi:spore coat associated protein CotJA [Paraclostridium sordellii]|nr:spore coat associated protein CotJA [Paeniclostridium sordellii]
MLLDTVNTPLINYIFCKLIRIGGILVNDRAVQKNCGCDLARPYVNNQIFSKMYTLPKALEYGTIFPELNLWDSTMYNKNLYRDKKVKNGGRR